MSVLDAPPLSPEREAPVDPSAFVADTRWALLIAPILFFAGYVLHPDIPADVKGAVAKMADVRGRLIAAKILVTAGALLWVPLVLLLRRLAPAGRGARTVRVGAWMAVVGTIFNALQQMTFGYLLWSVSAPGVSRSAGRVVLDATNHQQTATLPLSFFLGIPLFSIGLIVLAVGLWRSGTTPRWATVSLIVGVVLSAATGAGLAVVPGGLALTAATVAFVDALPRPRAADAAV